MSFAAEMKDFLTAADAISRVRYTNSRRRIFEQENKLPPGAPDEELPPSSFPGTGGGIGTKEAPSSPQVSAGTNVEVGNRGGGSFTQQAYDYYRSKGLPHAAAAGIAGNLMQESGGDPRVLAGVRTGDAGASKFAAQWNGARLKKLYQFAGSEKPTLQQQFDFVLEEMNAKSPYVDKQAAAAYDKLLKAGTVEEATQIFRDNFERPLDPKDITPRIQYALQAKDAGNYGAVKVAEGPAAAIPEDTGEQPPPQEGSTEAGVAQSGAATISVPEVVEDPSQAAPQVESGFDPWALGGRQFQQGGVIPDDDTMNFAPGGKVDPFNPSRSYTQALPAQASARPRSYSGAGGGGGGADWRSWGAGSPSQLKFRNRPVIPAPVSPPPPPPPAAPTGRFRITMRENTSGGNDRGAAAHRHINSPIGRGVEFSNWNELSPRMQNYLKAYPQKWRLSSLTEYNPATGIPGYFKEGGMVKTSETPRSRISRAEFDEMVRREEMRHGIGGQGGTDSARDRVARRLNIQERGVSSTAFRPGADRFPPAPQAPGRKTAAAPAKTAAPKKQAPPAEKVVVKGEQARVPTPGKRSVTTAIPAYPGEVGMAVEGPQEGEELPVVDTEGNPIIEAPEVRSSSEKLHKIGKLGIDFARGGAIPDDVEAEMRAHGGDRDAAVRRLNIRAGRGSSTAYHAPPKTKTAKKAKKAKPGRDQRKPAGKQRQGVPVPRPRPVEAGAPNVPIPQQRPSPGNPWDDMNKYPPDAAAAPARQYPPGVSPATSDDFITIWDLLPDFSGPSNQPYEQRKPEPTPRQPSPPAPYEQRKPEPTRSYDPDAQELANAFLDVGARILQRIVPEERAVDPNAPPARHPGLQTRGPTWYDPTEPTPDTGGTPYVEPPGGVRTVYARGGAIPDDTYPPPPAEGAGAPPSADPALTEAGPWGAPRGQQRAEGFQPGQFTAAAQRAAPGVQLGMSGINKFFGGIFNEDMGVPDEAASATKDAGLRRFAAGEGAATRDELKAIDISTGLDRVPMDEGTKNLERIDRTVQWYLQRGQKEKAEAVAASLLMYGAVEVKRSGMMAATALDAFQKSGDPQDLRNAKLAIQRAHSMIPDGINLTIDIDPKTRQIVATTIDDKGKQQSQVVDPGAIPGLLQQAMDGSAYWKAAFQIGQPRLAEQQMANEAAGAKAGSEHEWQLQFDEYKNKRELEEQLDKEDREAARKLFERQLDTEEGRTETERRNREMDSYFSEWNDRLSAAATPEEKQKLFTEGLAYRFQNTQDRQQPIDSNQLAFIDDRADKYADDLSALQQMASAIAQKNDALDAAGAMQVVDALIMSPVVNNPDGTLNVGGYSLVFNPQLLPQLSALRKKYGQAESG